MGWTDERVELLRKLWQDGLSASQIARQLGGVTRNAVIGKVHRLGLSGRAEPSRPRSARARTVTRRAAARSSQRAPSLRPSPVAPATRPAAYVDTLPGTATALTLGAHMCRWPIGDPVSEMFSFCGRRALGTGPYCNDHARVAYAPTKAGAADLVRALRRYFT